MFVCKIFGGGKKRAQHYACKLPEGTEMRRDFDRSIQAQNAQSRRSSGFSCKGRNLLLRQNNYYTQMAPLKFLLLANFGHFRIWCQNSGIENEDNPSCHPPNFSPSTIDGAVFMCVLKAWQFQGIKEEGSYFKGPLLNLV